MSNAFALFDKLAAARAEIEKPPEPSDTGVGLDYYQLQRDAERRERLGQLRAREHAGARPNGMMNRRFG